MSAMKRVAILGLGLLFLACANGCCCWSPCGGFGGLRGGCNRGCGTAGYGMPAYGAPVMQGSFNMPAIPGPGCNCAL